MKKIKIDEKKKGENKRERERVGWQKEESLAAIVKKRRKGNIKI